MSAVMEIVTDDEAPLKIKTCKKCGGKFTGVRCLPCSKSLKAVYLQNIKALHPISAERARELLCYDKDTGIFNWRVDRSNIKAGTEIKCLSNGYVQIQINSKGYRAHRLAWLYTYGEWPKLFIDHINGDRSDNRISNLRDVSAQINSQNVRAASRGSEAGLLGVTANKKRWSAGVIVDRKRIHLGTYDTPEQAHEAYLVAKRRLHEGCTI